MSAGVSWSDLRWIWRHPVIWMRTTWAVWLLAMIFVAKAFVIAEPVFAVTTAAEAWPIILALTAGVLVGSAVVPLDERLQAVAASWLFGVSVLRVLTYGDTIVRADISESAQVLSIGFAVHWTLIAIVAVWLPVLLEHMGREMAAESGRADDGRD